MSFQLLQECHCKLTNYFENSQIWIMWSSFRWHLSLLLIYHVRDLECQISYMRWCAHCWLVNNQPNWQKEYKHILTKNRRTKSFIVDLSTKTKHRFDMSSCWHFIWFWGVTWKMVCCDQYTAMGSESLIAFGSLSSSNIQIDTKWSNQNQQLSYCWFIIILLLLF